MLQFEHDLYLYDTTYMLIVQTHVLHRHRRNLILTINEHRDHLELDEIQAEITKWK